MSGLERRSKLCYGHVWVRLTSYLHGRRYQCVKCGLVRFDAAKEAGRSNG